MEKLQSDTPKILVVDDEPQFERLLLQRFRKWIKAGEYDFVFAEHGRAALAKLQEHPDVDIVLTDLNMPVMDGFELLSQLKADHPRLRTVVISAYGDLANIRKAMNSGAFDFITKPIDFSDLKTTIDKTLSEAALIAKAQEAQALAQSNERLRELHQMKSHFFTNISHELRTPLTIINGITESLTDAPEQWAPNNLAMIRRNSNLLLDLVNQILDLRKLESGKLEVHWVQADVIAFVHYLLEPFLFWAEKKGVQIHFLPHQASLTIDYDPDKLLRVVSNLLSNAIKHTPEGGHVYLMLSTADHQWILQVKDTGVGIEAEQLPLVFDRYYQQQSGSQGGTGIGLALCKELVQLMEGTIQVESPPLGFSEKTGTQFTVHLPLHRHAPTVENPFEITPASRLVLEKTKAIQSPANLETTEATDMVGPSLLIVEDNDDILAYLHQSLRADYQLLIARNGQEGIDLALEKIPDLIISDVMMPLKDGFELCQTLKSDERSSHIPIILLTAKADLDNRITGWQKGADAYLQKPFHLPELRAVLEQLVAQRAKLRARYATLQAGSATDAETPAPADSDAPFALEDAFIAKAKGLVEAHLADSTFSGKILCKKLGMSYSVLHRKLAALVGRSPSRFIRAIRLYQARQLLRATDDTVSEIAYDCGFNDPKFFSRVFSEEFGVTPSSLRQS